MLTERFAEGGALARVLDRAAMDKFGCFPDAAYLIVLKPGYYSGARTISNAGQVLINALVAAGLAGHNEALAWRSGELADLGAGTPIGQNERGQVIVDTDTDPSGPVQAALFTIDWGT